jgi:hypothetical protein
MISYIATFRSSQIQVVALHVSQLCKEGDGEMHTALLDRTQCLAVMAIEGEELNQCRKI